MSRCFPVLAWAAPLHPHPTLSLRGRGALASLRGQALDLREDLLVFGKAAGVVFAPDLRIVDVDVEDAAGAFDQFGRHLELLLDRIRQTGGRRKVVSLSAVFDGDVHC